MAEPTLTPETDPNSGSLMIPVKHRQGSTVQLKTPIINQPTNQNPQPMGLNKILLYSDDTSILKSSSFVLADNMQLRKRVNKYSVCHGRIYWTKEKALGAAESNYINIKPLQVSEESQVQRYPNLREM